MRRVASSCSRLRVAPSPTIATCATPCRSLSSKSTIVLALMGAPGVGKGTFASRIGPSLKIPNVSTGDLIRAEIKAGTEVGKQLKKVTDAGGLVSDDTITAMLKKRVASADASNGFLLDGYPRRVSQADALRTFAEPDIVLNITLREDVLIEKISSRRVCPDCGENYNIANIQLGEINMPPLLPKVEGQCDKCNHKLVQRSDDTVETVKERLLVYESQTRPLIEYYRKAGSLLEFSVKKGIADLPEIQRLIEDAIRKQGKGQLFDAAKARAAAAKPVAK